ncbi:MAG: hypothetical protein AAF725_22635, partial [Acidobacteriota bacterium]
ADDTAVAGGDHGQTQCSERDFEMAYSYWKTLRYPRAIFLSCKRLPEKLDDIDSRLFDRVVMFHKRFDAPDKNRFAHASFQDPDDLRTTLERELSALAGCAEQQPDPAAAGERPRGELRGSTQFERKMEPGKAYEVSFLSLEIAGWADLAERHSEQRDLLQTLSTSFLELVKQTAKNYGGEVFSWSARGGLLMFWSKRSYDHAIMTGLKVLHNLPVFNLDPQQNPLGLDVEIRAAAHDAVIVFQLPIEEISSADITYIGELQSENTEGGELTITRRLLERIDERLRPHFQFKGRFEREPIYSCKLPSTRGDAHQANLEDFVARLEKQLSLAGGLLGGPPGSLDVSATDSLATAIDEAYSVLNKFCHTYASIDREWPPRFLAQLGQAASALRRLEAQLWDGLRTHASGTGLGAAIARRLDALAHAASRRRSRAVVILEKLEERCASLASGAEPAAPSQVDLEQVEKAIKHLLRADELDNETALTELLLHQKTGFMSFLGQPTGDAERHQRLIRKLWDQADLVLLDDLYSIRGHRRAEEPRVFDLLVQPQVAGPRFQIIRQALESPHKPEEIALGQMFAQVGIRPTPQDLQIVWRCLVIGHPSEAIRTFSALKLTPTSMWSVVSHPSIPVSAIYAIAERMATAEGEDAKKIFFDCVRSRLEQEVESFRTQDQLNLLTKLIVKMLSFAFLVETGYFERFDDLLARFLNHAQGQGMKVEYFEKLRKTLEEARLQAGEKGPAKPPAGIKSLPLTIQRRLAGEARYIYWFVTHPDPRIACETLRHIGLMHVERVLRLREINSNVLLAILRKPELFTRQQAILAALNHPKCTQEFANKYIPSMTRSRQGRQALEKIAQNPSASPVVRSTAKRAQSNLAKRMRR